MKFLIDRCAGRKLAEHLQASGHDVVRATDLGPDPRDRALLASAHAGQRVLVTIDVGFGALVFLSKAAHSGLIRLPDVSARQRIELIDMVLRHHASDLEEGKVITVQGGRIRISHTVPKPK